MGNVHLERQASEQNSSFGASAVRSKFTRKTAALPRLTIDVGAEVELNPRMRAILVLLLSCGLLVGCKHANPSNPATTTANSPTAGKRSDKQPAKGQTGNKVAPILGANGKVASVNPNLRFVVIDFALNPVPRVDQRLSVYRQGQKVGELKISAQARNSIVAADITAGEAQVGDEVRSE